MKNNVKFTVSKNGAITVKVSNSLFKEEFKKMQDIYQLDDMHIDLFKADGMMFVLTQAIQAWISGFDCEAKNDYYLEMDYTRISDERYGDTYPVYHVVNGQCIYEQEDGEDQEDNTEDLGEVGDDTNQVEIKY